MQIRNTAFTGIPTKSGKKELNNQKKIGTVTEKKTSNTINYKRSLPTWNTNLPSGLDDGFQNLKGVVFGLLVARELQNCIHLQELSRSIINNFS